MRNLLLTLLIVCISLVAFSQNKKFDFTTGNLAYWQSAFGQINTGSYTLPNAGALNSDGLILMNKVGWGTELVLVSNTVIDAGWKGNVDETHQAYGSWAGDISMKLKGASNNQVIAQAYSNSGGSPLGNVDLNNVSCTDPVGCYLEVRLSQGYGTYDSPCNRLKSIEINTIGIWAEAGNNISFVQGNVGIGTTADANTKLTVKGIIHSEEVKVDLNVPGPDYVFEADYPLASLEDTKAYIEQNKHLPGIPSSDEMQQNGVNLLEMNMKLLEKVEELTLYVIEQNNRIDEMKEENTQEKRVFEKIKDK